MTYDLRFKLTLLVLAIPASGFVQAQTVGDGSDNLPILFSITVTGSSLPENAYGPVEGHIAKRSAAQRGRKLTRLLSKCHNLFRWWAPSKLRL